MPVWVIQCMIKPKVSFKAYFREITFKNLLRWHMPGSTELLSGAGLRILLTNLLGSLVTIVTAYKKHSCHLYCVYAWKSYCPKPKIPIIVNTFCHLVAIDICSIRRKTSFYFTCKLVLRYCYVRISYDRNYFTYFKHKPQHLVYSEHSLY